MIDRAGKRKNSPNGSGNWRKSWTHIKQDSPRKQVEKLVADTKELKEYQEAEERQEDLERIPVLAREDISREDGSGI